ncbi:uncharacterized protein [Spinacia oleracea]|uniref:Signal peptidase complex catalytic subunit SEC11 n=1 Tax=Spinacia oleracea TaxID=3562 RepID=A0ABM3QS67_SPIOL|nr:uncharacterized protein LOC130461924 [Spinacia oleracea]
MAWVRDQIDGVESIKMRQLMIQVYNIGMVVVMAMVFWKALIWYTECESPISVVLSRSMEPSFTRGDILLLHNRNNDPIRVGEIVLFKVDGREIPIAHRVIEVQVQDIDGQQVVNFLTKGDNNERDDRDLYAHGQHWLQRDHIIGRFQLVVPYLGWVAINLAKNPTMKCLLIIVLGVCYLKDFIEEKDQD